MTTHIVVATFRPGTDMNDVFAVVTEERAQVAALVADGRLGSVHLSPERGTVFLEVFADDTDAARATVETLPMAAWWDLDVFPTAAPTNPTDAGWNPGGAA